VVIFYHVFDDPFFPLVFSSLIFFPTHEMIKILNLKERYPFRCECTHECEAGPSIFQSGFQLNRGRVRCPGCKRNFTVRIDSKNENMLAMTEEETKQYEQLPDACFRNATIAEEIELACQKGVKQRF
jgi:hypothetical protein